ncbi:helix-turn-helix domain-containing protein [Tunicatimonas pelagia]|uniref:helix-turn-helix domain-containing protein n=1 Tax=Tunicatimonas pelagia TaxID=931531 RepID=UPI002666D8A9|nr:helix-turn-helix domain-containing protein [Tunicatimonas pelagia]WKN43008.1 helix-turn-helix domain-containing protein [Tunicatimonas pelagia]
MSTLTFYYHANTLTFYSILLCGLLTWKNRKRVNTISAPLCFLTCVGAYLMYDEIENILVERTLIIGGFLVPFTFWVFSHSLFNIGSIPLRTRVVGIIASLVPYLCWYLPLTEYTSSVIALGSAMLSILFAVMAVVETKTPKSKERSQYQLKIYAVYAIAITIVFTVLSDFLFDDTTWLYTVVVQRLLILLLSSLFIFSNFAINENLTKPKEPATKNPALATKIRHKMSYDKLYRVEKLTIGQLAKQLNEQEYRVRRAINDDLGFKNFLDFVNSFRIKEATGILKDQARSDLTVLQIAYQTGFNSIAPFNRAFKLYTGMTPTKYRKSWIDQNPSPLSVA